MHDQTSEPLRIEVQKVEVISFEDNQSPPIPVAHILIDGDEHEVPLSPVDLAVDRDTFETTNLPYDYIERLDQGLEDFFSVEKMEPTLSMSLLQGMVDELSERTGNDYEFYAFSGDQYDLRVFNQELGACQIQQFDGLYGSFFGIQELLNEAPAAPEQGPDHEQGPDQPEPSDLAAPIAPRDVPPEPIDFLDADDADIKSGMHRVRAATLEQPLGQPHNAQGRKLPPELVAETLKQMLEQLDRNIPDKRDETPPVAVKR